jgi:heme-degrading monooxygenase HmoA
VSGDYVYLWEYRVVPESAAAFERVYGPEGEWVRLFRRAAGYRDTTLYRDRADPGRYVTVDRWRSREAFDVFRARFAAEFEALDARCEALTLREREVGRFEPVE